MKVLHTGITVKDIDKAVLFYRDILGLELKVPPTDPVDGLELSIGVGVPGACLRQAVLESGDAGIELFEYLSPVPEFQSPVPINNPGPGHVAFEVDDIHAEYQRLRGLGVMFYSEPNFIAEGPLAGWKWVYFEDPDGVVLELVEKS